MTDDFDTYLFTFFPEGTRAVLLSRQVRRHWLRRINKRPKERAASKKAREKADVMQAQFEEMMLREQTCKAVAAEAAWSTWWKDGVFLEEASEIDPEHYTKEELLKHAYGDKFYSGVSDPVGNGSAPIREIFDQRNWRNSPRTTSAPT